MTNSITYLGRVINVNSGAIEVEISKDIPSAAPIINGRIYKLGQIGTFVKIPMGPLVLFGIVSAVSNSPSLGKSSVHIPDYGTRFLTVHLVGEKVGNATFERGVGTFPTIHDEVHVVTEDDLRSIYGDKQKGFIEIGKHSSSDDLPVFVDLHKLVLRHTAILGSTGSGKSNTTGGLLKKILHENPGARIILVDPHGEYSSAFEGRSKTFKIGDNDNPLQIPFWTMTFDELSFFLVGRTEGQEKPEDKDLREKILELKKLNAETLKSGPVDENFITADSPIPFDLKKMWHDFDRQVNGTFTVADPNSQNRSTEALLDDGNPLTLTPAKFQPYTMGSTAPFKSKNQTMYSYVKKIFSRLKDTRYDFMFNPGQYSGSSSELDADELLKTWIDHEKNLTILDLSGIPFELLDISVGLITRIIYDSMYWGRYDAFTGRQRPLLLAYEEAHAYLPRSESKEVFGYARKAVERIFKEGRKFGVGAMVITQRPSEISETVLSQVGTFIALRLTNGSDQGTVKSAAPNNMNSLMDLLSSLRIGEAIVVGEAMQIPSRIRVELIEPRPSSNDPELVSAWAKKFDSKLNNYKPIVTSLRERRIKGK